MKARLFSIVILMGLLLASTVLAEKAPSHRERFSTDPGKDLERVHFRGKIENLSGQKALLVTEDGAKVTVHLGPQHYWREKGYSMRTGVVVDISGWGEMYGEDGGYCYAAEIRGDGFFFDLSDSQGYPRWADRNETNDNWRPTVDYYEINYGAPPWFWSPPPRYWHRPHHPYNGPRHCPPPPHHRGRHWR